ncbi:transcriptional regulator CynR [Paraburkholderia rhizosphaerae]|uniref:LysR family transcriptional regulator n=1 Tax=Paraburkholderia rhizosphaerae TaxID=480658 RepID=A0A4R8LWU6_9BURK|nr:transcriptional regulator CynR [Paraburkholderia rhizosphaerae]TDY52414.1 LysR family transcriptional regulator [Paraburkholderia rhizosphaerae]
MLLRHLRYLTAVVDHGSFTRAAQALHVSQPALSQQIKELEDRLGAQLLDRSGRQVRPTDRGAMYLRYVRRIQEELDEAARAVKDVEDLSIGSLRLGVTPTVANYLIGPLVQRFRSRYPGISLSVRVASQQEEIEPALRDDELDLGIGFGDMPVEDIEVTPLHKERLALIAGAGRWPARKTVVTRAELLATPLALLDASFSIRRSVDRYFAKMRARPAIVVEANSITVLIEIVRQTDVATILPANVAGPGLSTAKFQPELELRPAALLQRRNAYRSAATQAFVAMALEATASFVEVNK